MSPESSNRTVPLALLGIIDPVTAEPVAALLRAEGVGLAMALGDRSCLRMATALYPDIILLDPRLPRTLLTLLHAHPLSKRAYISWSRRLGEPTLGLSQVSS
jgi:hypothetical protein